MAFKYGKKAPKRLMRLPALGDFLDTAKTWPVVPAHGWEYAVPADKMSILGNDQWGDCAPAGFLGQLQAQSYSAGVPLDPNTDDALNLYSEVTGFDINQGPPGDNPTDQGTALTDLLTYAMKTGVKIGSTLHKIVGFAALDISSVAQMKWSAYTFGGNYLGINCPEKCQQDTTDWNFGPGLPIDGGHCVIQGSEGGGGGKTRSWGMWIPTSWEFYLSYVDEGYIFITEDWVNKNTSKTPSGLDLSSLLAAMKLI